MIQKLLPILLFLSFQISAQDSVETIVVDTLAIELQDSANVEVDSVDEVKEQPQIATIIGVGDMMLGTHYPNDSYLPPKGDCSFLMADVKHILEDADVTFGNLEGSLTDSHKDVKKCNDPKTCYAFAMPTSFIDCFMETGFDVVSIANNHSGDFEYQGRKSTMRILDSVGIAYGGLMTKPTAIFEKNGLTYGFAAFAPNWGTCSIHDYKKAKQIVAGLDSVVDIVIVSFHGGAEGSKYEHVTKETEMFLGTINRGNVYKFAHAVVDAGADIVFGHGPHVTRALDLYKDRFIIYSLGNFATYRRFNLSGPNGIAPIVKVFTTQDGTFQKAEITPIYQNEATGVHIDSQKRVIKRLQVLTKEDIPEAPITISDDGIVLKQK